MKKITHFSIALCLLTAGVVVAQSNMSIDAIAERMNDRLDAFDPERRTAIACERVAQTDRSLVDAQTAYLRAGAEQFVAARNQALDQVQGAILALQDASVDRRGELVSEGGFSADMFALRDVQPSTIAEALTIVVAAAESLKSIIESLDQTPDGFEALGDVLSLSGDLRLACADLTGVGARFQ